MPHVVTGDADPTEVTEMNDGLDVGRIAETADRLGLVSPDMQGPDGEDEVVVIIHIHGGCLADVGASETAGLKVVVVDDDVLEDGESDGVWTESVGDLRHWSRETNAALIRAAGELPEALRQELGVALPTSRPTEDDGGVRLPFSGPSPSHTRPYTDEETTP